MNTSINIARHPYDSTSILNWMLRAWSLQPEVPLIILTPRGMAASVDNRLRVRLAKTRKLLRSQHTRGVQEFGFKTTSSSWDDNGFAFDALYLERFVTKTQQFSMIFESLSQG